MNEAQTKSLEISASQIQLPEQLSTVYTFSVGNYNFWFYGWFALVVAVLAVLLLVGIVLIIRAVVHKHDASATNVEMGYANGATIDGYGLSTEEGKALYNAADTIYREMFEKADEYQREEPDAICARISYESKGIDKSDIEVVSIARNKGDIGELVGFVNINDDTLRFLADRDGNIMSLMPKGTPMQDVNTVPIADEVKCIICDAIHDGILEYNREAEIASNAIVKEAEERGWSVRKFESGEMLLTNSTYGGGLLINAREDTLAQDIKDYADNFDVDQTMDMWRSARNKGVQGIPELNKDLEREAKEARDMCVELSDAAAEVEASIDDREIESERQTDDYER